MKCKLNDKCEFGDLCQQATRHDSITVLGCSSYKSKKPLTNEEWLKKANTEQLAEFIATQCADAIRLWREMQYWTAHEKCKSNKWYVWLKEKHK